MNVEYTRDRPSGASLVTNTSLTPRNGWIPFTCGNPEEAVLPVTYTAPDASTAIPCAISAPLPPRKVEYSTAEPSPRIFITNTSAPPEWLYRLLRVGKVADSVDPVTNASPSAFTATAFTLSVDSPARYVPQTGPPAGESLMINPWTMASIGGGNSVLRIGSRGPAV